MKPFPSAAMIGSLRLSAIVVALAALHTQAARVAIIDFSGNAPAEALLSAQLSAQTNVEVLERAELQRLAGEKKLAALGATREYSALGGLLRADGLLILEGGKDETQPAARLISVKTGACLLSEQPVRTKVEEWAQRLSRRTAQMIGKLDIERGKAMPVAVVNLRAAMYFSKAAALEKALPPLLEQSLTESPNVIVLERRRLGDASFERSLDATDLPPLWNGIVLVDGSFDLAIQDGTVTVNLRLRDQQGKPVASFVVMGNAKAPEVLTRDIAAKIIEILGADRPPATTSLTRESAEFFDEAVWAWSSGAYEKAEESLAAARALGNVPPVADWLDSWLFCEKAVSGGFFYNGKRIVQDPPSLQQQISLLEQALAAFERFQASGAKLTLPDIGNLKPRLVTAVSELLNRNDEEHLGLDVASLRETVRKVAGMETAGNRMPYSLGHAASFAKTWAANGPDLLAFYEKLLRANHRWKATLLMCFPKNVQTALGPRFRDDRNMVAAYENMLERLATESSLRPQMLLIRAGSGKTEDEKKFYRAYMSEVAARVVPLFESGMLPALLHGDGRNQSFHEDFQGERAELLAALFEKMPGYCEELFDLIDHLEIPKASQAKIWEDFIAYRDRCLASASAKDRAEEERAFNFWQGRLLSNNPEIPLVKPAGVALKVSRFWHPYRMSEWAGKSFNICDIAVGGGSAWIVAVGSTGATKGIVQISLPGLVEHSLELPGVSTGSRLFISPDHLWVIGGEYPGGDQPMRMSLCRMDRKSGQVKIWPLPNGDHGMVIDGRVFLFYMSGFTDTGLAEFDPETGSYRLLISSRRNPPETPFDGRAGYVRTRVIEGPGGMPGVVLQTGVFRLGGDWRKITDISYPASITFKKLTLLANQRLEVFLIDPEKTEPICWLSGSKPSAGARWRLPAGFEVPDEPDKHIAFRKDELFILHRVQDGSHRLHWWFKDGPDEGIELPLHFEIPKTERNFLATSNVPSSGFVNFEGMLDPNRIFYPLRILADSSGLVLTHSACGFWFIPNGDLEKAQKEFCKRL